MNHCDYLEKNRKKVLEQGSLTEEFIEFYNDIFLFQGKYSDIFKNTSLRGMNPDSSVFPVLNPDDISFSDEEISYLEKSLHDLISSLSKKNEGLKLGIISEYFTEDRTRYSEVLKLLLEKNFEGIAAIGKELRTGIEEFFFIIINWLKPFLKGMRLGLEKEIDSGKWLKSECPFCGFHADMAKIVENRENKRVLHCALCENEWDFRRIYCPVCSNENPETLGFLTGEDEVYRIDYCDECKGYIKTVRIQKQFDEGSYDLLVENIITPGLDAAALELGYKRP